MGPSSPNPLSIHFDTLLSYTNEQRNLSRDNKETWTWTKKKGKNNLSWRGRKVALFLKKYEITLFFSLKEAGRDSWKFILNLNAVLLTNYQYVILKVLNWTVQKN